jgi:hypothetical protein
MKASFIFLVFCFNLLNSFGQVNFEKGYIIDNKNQKIECLIKNYDQKSNPTEIEYKTSEDSYSQKAGLSLIQEFGITGYSKFIRVEIDIDRSSNDISRLSTSREPEWSKEQKFLKVIVEGRASLYSYEDKRSGKYFYSVAGSGIRQLIYKEYLSEDGKFLLTNNGFRKQLWTDVKCKNATTSSVDNIQYSESALKKYFIKYNDCSGSVTTEFKAKGTKNPLRIRITSGFTLTSASFSVTDMPYKNTEFGKEIDYRVGIEGEFLLPVNKGKWRIVLEPSYQHYSSISENYLGNATIEYQSLEFPLGLRYYVFLNKKLNLFANTLYVFNSGLNFNSAINFDYQGAKPIIIDTESCLAFGIGLNYNRLSAELRINSTRNIVGRYTYHSEYHISSFIIGYRIF